MKSEILYEDQWGEIIARADKNLIEIRWFDATEDMEGDQFNEWLKKFADCVESKGFQGCLVDAVQFKMSSQKMSLGWRDENIIPRYNAAGVEKFAFVMPKNMPSIGETPKPEGPASFPTAYFGQREQALSWLTPGNE